MHLYRGNADSRVLTMIGFVFLEIPTKIFFFLCNQRDFRCVRPTGHPGHDLPREGGRVFAPRRNEIIVHHAPAIGAELPEPHLPIGSTRHRGPGGGHQ